MPPVRALPAEHAPHDAPALFHRHRETLITPRDFDLTPYFDVVKFNTVEQGPIDYRRIRWA
jgi:hypothetical protein